MRKIIEYNNLIWVDIIEPTEEDVEYLRNNFRLHPLTLKTIIPAIHHPDIEIFKNYLFIILHHLKCEEKENMEIRELDIIAGQNYLITSHYKIIQPLNSIFEECLKSEKMKEDYLKKGIGYLLFTILKKLLREKLTKVDDIENEIDLIENEIFLKKQRENIEKISLLKRKILDISRITEPQRIIFDSLKNVAPKFFGGEFQPHYFVLFRIYREMEDAIKNSKEIIEALESTSNILITLEMNKIIKIFTILQAIILPPTLFAALYGMNVKLPLAQNIYAFWILILIEVIIFVVTVIYLKIKKWF